MWVSHTCNVHGPIGFRHKRTTKAAKRGLVHRLRTGLTALGQPNAPPQRRVGQPNQHNATRSRTSTAQPATAAPASACTDTGAHHHQPTPERAPAPPWQPVGMRVVKRTGVLKPCELVRQTDRLVQAFKRRKLQEQSHIRQVDGTSARVGEGGTSTPSINHPMGSSTAAT